MRLSPGRRSDEAALTILATDSIPDQAAVGSMEEVENGATQQLTRIAHAVHERAPDIGSEIAAQLLFFGAVK